MSEKIPTELQNKLLGLIEQLEKGIDFGKEQAPILVEQLLGYQFYATAINLFISILFCIGSIFLIKRSIDVLTYKIKSLNEPAYFPIIILSLIVLLFSFSISLDNIKDLIKIINYPNLFVMDYLKNIISK
jgi:hypothetical protein